MMPAEVFKFEVCVAGQAHFAVLDSRWETMALDQLEATLKQLSDIRFESWSAGQSEERLIEVTDKHGMSQGAHNVGFAIELEGLPLALGMRNR
jgi:hypothetical protein